MMKRDYLKPATRVVRIQHIGIICGSGTASKVSGNVFNNNIEAGSGTARARSFDAWGDEEEEE